ncbi:hypothetical protein RLOC_00005227 [Lonchura striata]|uniref:Uncharacterized protein n=1 Tax=Lonchura striata TaxID=40157 RepID=A0A218U9W8_9PASE|nr:hypothetical protein RLOC_00005227 [Lonchura striata domestica]
MLPSSSRSARARPAGVV